VIPTVTIEVVVAPGDISEGEVEQIVDHDREPQIQAVVLQVVVQLRGVKIPDLGGMHVLVMEVILMCTILLGSDELEET